jgi:MoxR-like ATPase
MDKATMNNGTMAPPPAYAPANLERRARVKALLDCLCQGLYEREEAMRLALLSALAGESIFLLGPPGVGKSLIARRLKYAFLDGVSFEYLMSKFSTPDEVFGPVSIKKLKEEDKYERITDRYLPGANVVFLDEIWKAGPAIQNALLTILNEKVYRNGDQDMKVNIRGIITASNELPPRDHSLDPIWDRFLLRFELDNIRQFRNFLNMIVDTEDVYRDDIPEALKVSEAELNAWSQAIDEVAVPAEVLNTLQVVKVKLAEYNARPQTEEPLLIHDRRWKKIVRLLRTSAFLNGRDRVDLMDCFLMAHALWNRPAQRDLVREITTEAIRMHGYSMAINLPMLRREVDDFGREIEAETQVQYAVTEERLLLVQDEYYELVKEDNQFEGVYVPARQFQQLNLDEPQVVNFYDRELNLVNRLKALKGQGEHAIDVYYNAARIAYPLRTAKAERRQTLFKPPHALVARFWEERLQQLREYIARQEQALHTEAPPELNDLDGHLFVEADLAAVVRANLDEVKAALAQLKLQLEKLQYNWTKETR